MIEIDISKLERGTHEGRVKVTRGGKTFWRKQRLGQKEDDISVDDFLDVESLPNKSEKAKYIEKLSTESKSYIDMIIDDPNTCEHVFGIRDYTGTEYLNINRRLKSENIESDKVNTKIKDISEFLKNAPKMSGIVYRGMGFKKDGEGIDKFNSFIDDLKNSDEILLPAFTSTSMDKNTAGRFSKSKGLGESNFNSILFEIVSKNGVFLNGASIRSDENEVLFDHHTTFMIKEIFKEDDLTTVILEEI